MDTLPLLPPMTMRLDLNNLELNKNEKAASPTGEPDTEQIDHYWQDFYSHARAATVPQEPSDFASHCADLIVPGCLVIDIGTGTGRDALHFSRSGFPVLAVDAAPSAIDEVRAHARRDNLTLRAECADAADLDACEAISQTIESHRADATSTAGVTVYSRFFLHSVPRDVQQSMLRWVAGALSPGEQVLLEYRTDLLDHYVFGSHFRRAVAPEQVHDDAGAAGLSVVTSEVSRDFAPFKDERPNVGRTTLRR